MRSVVQGFRTQRCLLLRSSGLRLRDAVPVLQSVRAAGSTARPYSRSTTAATALSPAEQRAEDRLRAAKFSFRVKGVSFEERQSHVRQLVAGDPVLLVREPENEYDENAIAVKKLDDACTHLGYVPKDANQLSAFKRSVNFGAIRSVGCASGTEPEMYGAVVEFQPSLAPLAVEALPSKFLHISAFILSSLDSEAPVRKLVLQQSQGRCQISGSTAEPLEVVPEWLVNDRTLHIKLLGFRAVARSLWKAQLVLMANTPLLAETVATICGINGWKPEHVLAYRRHLVDVARNREGRAWSLVLEDPLSTMGIDVPKNLLDGLQ